jgi:hypothetical protein
MHNLPRTGAALLAALGASLSALPSAATPGPPPIANCPSTTRIAVGVAPPPRLRIERQPPLPAYGDVWTPGYWGWNGSVNNYNWVPGLWVHPPRIGVLWTPPYWGLSQGVYLFNPGSWGQNVGYYGGVNYGYGYGGRGYEGVYWKGGTLYYNRTVNNFGALRFNTVYSKLVYNNRRTGGASYSTGVRGAQVRYAATGGRAVGHRDGGDRHDNGRGHAYGRLGGGPGGSDHEGGRGRGRSEGRKGGGQENERHEDGRDKGD